MPTQFEQVLEYANSPEAWFWNMLLIGAVLIQAFIFLRLVFKYRESLGVSIGDMKKGFRSGVIASFGPTAVVVVTGVALITQIGAPLTMARLGVAGSASYELYSANQGAIALGTELGAPDYGFQAYCASAWAMGAGAALMLIRSIIFVKPMSDARTKFEARSKGLGSLIGMSAALGAYGYISMGSVLSKKVPTATAAIVGGVTMFIVIQLSKRLQKKWISEWSIAISMVVGMAIASLV